MSPVYLVHWLCCSLIIRWGFIQMPSKRGAYLSNCMNSSLTPNFAVSFGQWWVLWPRLRINSATSISVVRNCSPCPVAHSMSCPTHLSWFMTTWFILHAVATQPWLSTKDICSTADSYSLTHVIKPDVNIAKRKGDTCEPCGTPLLMVVFQWQCPPLSSPLLFLRESSQSILSVPCPFSWPSCSSLDYIVARFGRLLQCWWEAHLSCGPFGEAAWALSTVVAAASTSYHSCLLRNCPLLISDGHSTSSDSSSATTSSITLHLHQDTDMLY